MLGESNKSMRSSTEDTFMNTPSNLGNSLLLSVIVPVYNVEEYLPRCLDSILNQSFTAFELILVDDGSEDSCAGIIDEFASRDPRIRVLHQPNSGVSTARNAGLRGARGSYISFIDPDDYIAPDMFRILLNGMKQNNAELGCCNFDVSCETTPMIHRGICLPKLMNKEQFYMQLFSRPRTVQGSVCNKIFLRSSITVFFDEHVQFTEDWLFLCQNHRRIHHVFYCSRGLYYYYDRPNSATKETGLSMICDLPVRRALIEVAYEISENVALQAESDYIDKCATYMTSLRGKKETDYHGMVKTEFDTYMRKNWRRVLSNPQINWKLKCLLLFYRISLR